MAFHWRVNARPTLNAIRFSRAGVGSVPVFLRKSTAFVIFQGVILSPQLLDPRKIRNQREPRANGFTEAVSKNKSGESATIFICLAFS